MPATLLLRSTAICTNVLIILYTSSDPERCEETVVGGTSLCSLNLCGSGTTIHEEFPYSVHGRKESSCILS